MIVGTVEAENLGTSWAELEWDTADTGDGVSPDAPWPAQTRDQVTTRLLDQAEVFAQMDACEPAEIVRAIDDADDAFFDAVNEAAKRRRAALRATEALRAVQGEWPLDVRREG